VGRGEQYEVKGYYPTRLFWDVHHPHLLVCQARRALADNQLEQNGSVDNEVFLIINFIIEINELLLLFC